MLTTIHTIDRYVHEHINSPGTWDFFLSHTQVRLDIIVLCCSSFLRNLISGNTFKIPTHLEETNNLPKHVLSHTQRDGEAKTMASEIFYGLKGYR